MAAKTLATTVFVAKENLARQTMLSSRKKTKDFFNLAPKIIEGDISVCATKLISSRKRDVGTILRDETYLLRDGFLFLGDEDKNLRDKILCDGNIFRRAKVFLSTSFHATKKLDLCDGKKVLGDGILRDEFLLFVAQSFYSISELHRCRGRMEKNFLSASLSTSLPLSLLEIQYVHRVSICCRFFLSINVNSY